jgi:hypothetical protein
MGDGIGDPGQIVLARCAPGDREMRFAIDSLKFRIRRVLVPHDLAL